MAAKQAKKLLQLPKQVQSQIFPVDTSMAQDYPFRAAHHFLSCGIGQRAAVN
ncbi:MAG TPA: hypothetical protein VFL31_00400 [Nitrospiraceae bacterium]|nr:hypothetical protein [Nitrospiraceae bacterium]